MTSIREQIKSKSHWRVVIHPTDRYYNQERIKRSELSSLIEGAQVRLRGWYYPHFKKEDVKIIDQNKISFSDEFEHHTEYLEFTTSGQFAHIFLMREDYVLPPEEKELIKSRFVFNKDSAANIDKFFEMVSAIYQVTEIFYFASNLAQVTQYNDVEELSITIELSGVKSRMLYIWDTMRSLHSPYICNLEKDIMKYSKPIGKDDLIAQFDSYALDVVIEFFQLFGWDAPNEAAIKEDQKRLLERRI